MGEFMAVLAIDTTTIVAATAVVKSSKVLAEVSLGVQRNHAERILPTIDLVLREAGIELKHLAKIAVSIGPGSFTGQRIGLSLAKGLAEGLEIPMVPVSTMHLLALQLSTFEGYIVPLLDAQRQQYYTAVFRSTVGVIDRMEPDQAIEQSDLAELLHAYLGQQIILTGEAAPHAGAANNIRVAPSELLMPRAGVLGIFAESSAGVEPQVVVPNYIRPSSAKPRKGCE